MKFIRSLIPCFVWLGVWTLPASAVQDQRVEKFNTREVKQYYKVKDKSGVKDRKLWVTTDNGAAWEPTATVEWGEDASGQMFFIFRAPADGRYGLTLQFFDFVTNSTPAPQPGERPRFVAWVDTATPPPGETVVQVSAPVWVEPRGTPRWVGGRTVRLEWVTPENGIKPSSAALYWSVDEGPWTLITKGLANSGEYWWMAPVLDTETLRLRVTVTDLKGKEIASKPSAAVQVHVQTKPDIPGAKRFFQKATLQRAQQNRTEAALNYLNAIKLWPEYAEAFSDLALTCYEDGRYPKALEYFLRTIEVSPTNPTAYVNAGYAFLKLGLADDAVQKFRDAIEIGISTKAVAVELGEVLWDLVEWHARQKRTDQAREICELILKLEHAKKSLHKKAEDYLASKMSR